MSCLSLNPYILTGIGVFISTHVTMIQCYYYFGIYKKYTDWAYTHFIVCFIAHFVFKNELLLNTLFTFAYVSAQGLIGIHGFYISTGYNLLREFAFKISYTYGLKKQPLIIYLFADGIIHVLPCIIMNQFSEKRLLSGFEGLSVSLLSWLCHISYTPALLQGSFDPCDLYKVRRRKKWQIYLAWTILSSNYFYIAYRIFIM